MTTPTYTARNHSGILAGRTAIPINSGSAPRARATMAASAAATRKAVVGRSSRAFRPSGHSHHRTPRPEDEVRDAALAKPPTRKHIGMTWTDHDSPCAHGRTSSAWTPPRQLPSYVTGEASQWPITIAAARSRSTQRSRCGGVRSAGRSSRRVSPLAPSDTMPLDTATSETVTRPPRPVRIPGGQSLHWRGHWPPPVRPTRITIGERRLARRLSSRPALQGRHRRARLGGTWSIPRSTRRRRKPADEALHRGD